MKYTTSKWSESVQQCMVVNVKHVVEVLYMHVTDESGSDSEGAESTSSSYSSLSDFVSEMVSSDLSPSEFCLPLTLLWYWRCWSPYLTSLNFRMELEWFLSVCGCLAEPTLMFSWTCCRVWLQFICQEFRLSGIWHWSDGLVIPDIWKDHTAFIFRIKESKNSALKH
jgi:hypothetical protein